MAGHTQVGHMQIGQVADLTGLSLRTIRYYEEVGLVVPSARSQGGFRLYGQADVDRLDLVRRMKPLGFQLEEMRELLGILDLLSAAGAGPGRRRELRRLREFWTAAQDRCEALRAQLRIAEDFAAALRSRLPAEPAGAE